MKTYGIAYVAAAFAFLVLDAVWLMLMAERLYRAALPGLLLERFRLMPASLFYLLHVTGIVVFAISPALREGQWTTAMTLGALFGLCAYGTYDLTNAATLRGWSTVVTAADLGWGTVATAMASLAGYLVVRWTA